MSSEAEAVLKQIYPCWNAPVFAPISDNPVVVLRLLFGPKGEVQRAEVLNEGSDPPVIQLRVDVSPEGEVRRIELPGKEKAAVDPFFRALAESAMRAVKRCSPVELPSRDYVFWRQMVLVFDPRAATQQ